MPSYLTAGKIKEGMSGTISGEPKEEKHDFQDGKGEKLMFRIPIKLDTPIEDDYAESDQSDWIWNPGVFARAFLEEQLGSTSDGTYQTWINTHGSFHPRAWKSKNKSGFAWHFIPDEEKIVEEAVAMSVAKDLGIPSGPTKTLYECAYCNEAGDSWSTTSEANFIAHGKKFHPEKVTGKVGTRMKKE